LQVVIASTFVHRKRVETPRLYGCGPTWRTACCLERGCVVFLPNVSRATNKQT
jgi:hypothetical protein